MSIIVVVALVVVAFVAFLVYQARLVLRPEYDDYNARMDAGRWVAPPEDPGPSTTPAPAERAAAVDKRRGPATA